MTFLNPNLEINQKIKPSPKIKPNKGNIIITPKIAKNHSAGSASRIAKNIDTIKTPIIGIIEVTIKIFPRNLNLSSIVFLFFEIHAKKTPAKNQITPPIIQEIKKDDEKTFASLNKNAEIKKEILKKPAFAPS